MSISSGGDLLVGLLRLRGRWDRGVRALFGLAALELAQLLFAGERASAKSSLVPLFGCCLSLFVAERGSSWPLPPAARCGVAIKGCSLQSSLSHEFRLPGDASESAIMAAALLLLLLPPAAASASLAREAPPALSPSSPYAPPPSGASLLGEGSAFGGNCPGELGWGDRPGQRQFRPGMGGGIVGRRPRGKALLGPAGITGLVALMGL